jgi:hypothetical protein
MKSTNFLQEPGIADAWAKLAHALAFYPQPVGGGSSRAATKPAKLGIFERLDRWLWRQQMKEREAWLAQSKDIAELEQRMRMLERVGSRYY